MTFKVICCIEAERFTMPHCHCTSVYRSNTIIINLEIFAVNSLKYTFYFDRQEIGGHAYDKLRAVTRLAMWK